MRRTVSRVSQSGRLLGRRGGCWCPTPMTIQHTRRWRGTSIISFGLRDSIDVVATGGLSACAAWVMSRRHWSPMPVAQVEGADSALRLERVSADASSRPDRSDVPAGQDVVDLRAQRAAEFDERVCWAREPLTGLIGADA